MLTEASTCVQVVHESVASITSAAVNIFTSATNCHSVHCFVVKTEKPSVVKELVDQQITEDEDCVFETTVTGKPAPTVQWSVYFHEIVTFSNVGGQFNSIDHHFFLR
jgi:hypothetical protein